jgi:glycosyltransferase involved in cell wall biosynthesis
MNAATGESTAELWSVVVAYYNEADFFADTLHSLGRQSTGRFRLILVDNASTDGSESIARGVMAQYPHIAVDYLHEAAPGQVNALETGIAAVTTPFVGTFDADTFYPPDFLAAAQRLLMANPQVAATIAIAVSADAPHGAAAHFRRQLYSRVLPKLLRHQALDGGFGYCFRTGALRAAGSYSLTHWPYVLYDHELINRVRHHGAIAYAPDLWCISSDRRPPSSNTRWTLTERILYHATPKAAKDWFFYQFLAARFKKRQMHALNQRTERAWDTPSSNPLPD